MKTTKQIRLTRKGLVAKYLLQANPDWQDVQALIDTMNRIATQGPQNEAEADAVRRANLAHCYGDPLIPMGGF